MNFHEQGSADYTLDGRFLAFTGLNAEALRRVIVSSRTDDEVLAWVQDHAKPVTALEKQACSGSY